MGEDMVLAGALGLKMAPGKKYQAIFSNGREVSAAADFYQTHAFRAGKAWGFVRGRWLAEEAMKAACLTQGVRAQDGEVVEAVLVDEQVASPADAAIAPTRGRLGLLPWRNS